MWINVRVYFHFVVVLYFLSMLKKAEKNFKRLKLSSLSL